MKSIYVDKMKAIHTSDGQVYIELKDGTTLVFEGSELYRDLLHIVPMAKKAHEWNNTKIEELWKELKTKQ